MSNLHESPATPTKSAPIARRIDMVKLGELMNDVHRANEIGDEAFARAWDAVSAYINAGRATPAASDTEAAELPELPDCLSEVRAMFRGEWDYVSPGDNYYTANQMRTYARAAIASDRARIAQSAPAGTESELVAAAKHEIARLKEELFYYTRTINPGVRNPEAHYALEPVFAAAPTPPDQPVPDLSASMRAFVDEVLGLAFEGGTADGDDIQAWGVKHGLLAPVEVSEACGESCNCARECGMWPVTCYRKTYAPAAPSDARDAQGEKA